MWNAFLELGVWVAVCYLLVVVAVRLFNTFAPLFAIGLALYVWSNPISRADGIHLTERAFSALQHINLSRCNLTIWKGHL